ncbi:MAG TPA: hypothetical protein VND45_16385, partial [Thermoanaerobaculia bacterium]|nr:hypothetical protein [Thermoanaerobaculia bacterium]
MDLTWSTIEEVARTSDDSAVRRRFAYRNFRWLVAVLIFFTFVALIQAVERSRGKPFEQHAIGFMNLAFTAVVLFSLWAPSFREWTRRYIAPIFIVVIAVEYTFLLAYTRTPRGEWLSWAVVVPLMMLAMRMAAAELVLLHGTLLTGALMMCFVVSPPKHTLPGVV